MNQLPLYIPVVFALTTFLTVFLMYRASHNTNRVLLFSLLWLAVQGIIAAQLFYTVTDVTPPRLLIGVGIPMTGIAILFLTKKGRVFLDGLQLRWLTAIHIVRIPVELVLFLLFGQGFIPELMTFEGRNPDILSGITAIAVLYFLWKRSISRSLLLAWNFICLALLANIVVHAILSAPSPFQQLAFDQPNVGVLYFPYIWLPSFIVPVVLLSHLAAIRQLVRTKQGRVKRTFVGAGLVKGLTS